MHNNGTQRDALPHLPPWVNAESPNTWAPDVSQLDDGSFVMYYSATTAQYRKHCIGAATSPTILGPYSPLPTPLFCPIAQGGTIDASGYNDSGQRYVVYKVDGNSLGHGGPCGNTRPPIMPTPLILQPMSTDGITPQGASTILLNNSGIIDMGVIEAPSLVRIGTIWVLFFSSGCFYTPYYTVNYATAPSIKGPYTRAEVPLFAAGNEEYDLNGPGGMSIYKDGKHMVFHARNGRVRALHVAVVSMLEGEVLPPPTLVLPVKL